MPGYVLNCFLLVLPVLLLNLVFARHLPPGYQPSQWNDVPAAVTVPENALRVLVMALPLLLPITIDGTAHLVGLLLYLAGLAAYATSWAVQIHRPASAWSSSIAGFLAPAYTPALWLAGIGLIGTRPVIAALPYHPWVFFTLAVLFLTFHNLHAAIAYRKTSRSPRSLASS